MKMSAVRTRSPTLAAAIWPGDTNAALRAIVLVAVGVLVMTLSAKVRVPFVPVPVTLQTLALPLIAAAYGSRLGTATIIAYLAAGLVGLPVFTNTPPLTAGPLYFLGTTGGYLVAYPLAAWIVGALSESGAGRSLPALFGAMLAGDVLILAMGYLWLAFAAHLANGGVGLGADAAFQAGVLPFLLADLVKIGLAAALTRASWGLLANLRA
jgi:biotin transport system substrate-specific component